MKKYLIFIFIYFITHQCCRSMDSSNYYEDSLTYRDFLALNDQAKRTMLTESSVFYSSLLLSSPDNVRCYCRFIIEEAQFHNTNIMYDMLLDLVWACLNNIFLIHSCLAQDACKLIKQTNHLLSLAETFITCGFDVNTQNSMTKQTLLHRLAERTDTSGSDKIILNFLLRHGANPILQDSQEQTALQILEHNISKLQEKNQVFPVPIHKLRRIGYRWRKEILGVVPTYQF